MRSMCVCVCDGCAFLLFLFRTCIYNTALHNCSPQRSMVKTLELMNVSQYFPELLRIFSSTRTAHKQFS